MLSLYVFRRLKYLNNELQVNAEKELFAAACVFMFQPQFNQLSFQVIGDDPAPTYFSVSTSGFTSLNQAQVRVRSNLANGNQDRYFVSYIYHSVHSTWLNQP